MECLICGFQNKQNVKKCSQCESDLECFDVLDSINETTNKQNSNIFLLYTSIFAAVFLLVLTGALLTYFFMNNQSYVKSNNEIKAILAKQDQENKKLLSALASIKAKTDKAKTEEKIDPYFFKYKLKQSDTLWKLARRFYRNGKMYPIFLEHNKNLKLNDNNIGTEILVFKRPIYARQWSKKIIRKWNKKRYLKYSVQEGDTWESISTKFYGFPRRTRLLKNLNGRRKKLRKGRRVLVYLQE